MKIAASSELTRTDESSLTSVEQNWLLLSAGLCGILGLVRRKRKVRRVPERYRLSDVLLWDEHSLWILEESDDDTEVKFGYIRIESELQSLINNNLITYLIRLICNSQGGEADASGLHIAGRRSPRALSGLQPPLTDRAGLLVHIPHGKKPVKWWSIFSKCELTWLEVLATILNWYIWYLKL